MKRALQTKMSVFVTLLLVFFASVTFAEVSREDVKMGQAIAIAN